MNNLLQSSINDKLKYEENGLTKQYQNIIDLFLHFYVDLHLKTQNMLTKTGWVKNSEKLEIEEQTNQWGLLLVISKLIKDVAFTSQQLEKYK